LSKAIIDENQVVVVEDINVKGLLKTRLAKSISDSGWSKFLTYLKYKAEWYGRTFIQVDRFFPPQSFATAAATKKKTWHYMTERGAALHVAKRTTETLTRLKTFIS
jgi:putative transposase